MTASVLFFAVLSDAPVDNALQWSVEPEAFPRLTELGWIWQGRSKSACAAREDYWERLGEFLDDCYDADLLCGCSLHTGVSLIKAEILRSYGPEYYREMAIGEALHKRKRIDLAQSSRQWVEARRQDGRLRYPGIADIYSRCFPGQPLPALDSALQRAAAIQQCLPRLVLEGLVELKQREYAENGPNSGI